MRSLERSGSNLAGAIPALSEPQGTSKDISTTDISGPGSALTFNIRVPQNQDPPEHLLLHLVMTFENGATHMRAIEANISAEGETVQETFRALIEGVRGWLVSSQEQEVAQLLAYPPVAWFRFVPPGQEYYRLDKQQQTEPQTSAEDTEQSALYAFDALPELDTLADAQGVAPIEDIEQLVADFWPEDETIEEFMATLRRWRDEGDRRHS